MKLVNINKMKDLDRFMLKCRACMNLHQIQDSIYDMKQFNDELIKMSDVMCKFTNLEVTKFNVNDHLPSGICDLCVPDLVNAYLFRQKCLNSDLELRQEYTQILKYLESKECNIIKSESMIEEYLIEVNDYTFDDRTNDSEIKVAAKDDLEDPEIFEALQPEVKIENNNTEIKDNVEQIASPKPDVPRKLNNRLLIFKCPICNKGFDRKDKMKRHAKIHDVAEDKYFCEYCSKGYKMLQTYKSHMKSHDPNNVNKCSYCNSMFSTSYELERHVRIHTGEKPFKCDDCDKGFAQRNGLVRHLVNFHKKDIGYSEGYGKTPHKKKPCLCEVCGAEKKNAFALKIHMRQHTGEKPHKCDVCDKSFVVPFQLKMHMRSHTGEKPHQCDLCEKSFSQRIGLEVHRRIHTGEKPCVCDICDKAFTVPSHLKMHMRSHTGEKPYKCEICNKGFTQNTILQNHMKSHTGNTFNCEFCAKGFNQKHNLKRHMKIHTGEKPYECPLCTRKFSEKLSMKYHVQTHSGEKPYSKLAARLKARKLQEFPMLDDMKPRRQNGEKSYSKIAEGTKPQKLPEFPVLDDTMPSAILISNNYDEEKVQFKNKFIILPSLPELQVNPSSITA